ncbi:MAG: hypothetical protein R2867_05355 [Caldilineaceae bacterium]
MNRPLNVVLDPGALEIVTVNSSERTKGQWISRLILLAAEIPNARGSRLCEIIAEIDGLVAAK